MVTGALTAYGTESIECANKVSEMDFFFVSIGLQPR